MSMRAASLVIALLTMVAGFAAALTDQRLARPLSPRRRWGQSQGVRNSAWSAPAQSSSGRTAPSRRRPIRTCPIRGRAVRTSWDSTWRRASRSR